jgi:hypothetical protein
MESHDERIQAEIEKVCWIGFLNSICV